MKSHEKIVLAVLMLGMTVSPCYAETVTKTTTTVTTIRTDAPIYMGPVKSEVELQELTLEDFQQLVPKTITAAQAFNEYKNELNQPRPNPTLVLYKMKISERDLDLADFQGVNVSPELARARYSEYMRMNPIPLEGPRVRYVYVYHTPLMRAV